MGISVPPWVFIREDFRTGEDSMRVSKIGVWNRGIFPWRERRLCGKSSGGEM
jgi:hypothetical protein